MAADDKESLLDEVTDAVESKFVAAKAAVASNIPLPKTETEARVRNVNNLLQMDMPRQLKKHAFLGNNTQYGMELSSIAQQVNWRIAEIGLPGVSGGKIHFVNPDQLIYGTKGVEHACSRSGMKNDQCADLAKNMRDQFMKAAGDRRNYGEDFSPQYKTALWPHSQPVNAEFSSTVVVPHLRGDEYDPFMTRLERIRYTNYHEAWHSLHPGEDKALEKETNRWFKSQDEIDRLRIRQESVADLGAVSEMIQHGADASIVDKVRNLGAKGDTEHYSAASLDAFRAKIDAMGVEKFRELGSKDLYAMIVSTIDDNSPTKEQVAYLRQEKQKSKPDFPATGDPAIDGFAAKAKALNEKSDAALANAKPAQIPKGPDMRDELMNRAFKIGKVITPASLLLAHQEMRFEMQMGSAMQSTKRYYDGNLSDLQSVFAQITTLNPSSVDYVTENLKRGVKLEDLEKAAKASIDAPPVHRKGFVTPPMEL